MIRKKLYILLSITLLTISFNSFGQKDWMRYRYDLIYGLGPSFFLGELGGNNGIGKNSIIDLDFPTTRFGTQIGFRYFLQERLAAQATLTYGLINGNDNKTTEYFRNDRGLSFRSPIYEFNVRLEYKIRKERAGHIYDLKGVRGERPVKLVTYAFAGIGVFGFNPKAKIDGEWIALQPIGTEGQNFIETRNPYKRVQICIPVGFQIKYLANRYWSYSFEVGPRFTFTDYIDDVSKTYANPEMVAEYDNTVNDNIAIRLADPKYGQPRTETSPGRLAYDGQSYSYYNEQRGDPYDKDFYMFAMISVHYKLKATRKGWPTFKK